jgi:excinuclease ABC subunit A
VIVIEHNLDVIKNADWIVDMGPEGGSGGGRVIAEGTPEQVAGVVESHTGRFLGPVLARSARTPHRPTGSSATKTPVATSPAKKTAKKTAAAAKLPAAKTATTTKATTKTSAKATTTATTRKATTKTTAPRRTATKRTSS